MAKAKSPTKNEIEMRRLELSHDFRMTIAWIGGLIFSILSFGLPLYVVRLAVADLAGKETIVSGDLSRLVAEMVGGGSALAVIGAVAAKNRSQRNELKRLRARCDQLESELEAK